MDVVCVFVNDCLDRACIAQLSKVGVKLIALRCAGFNNVDLEAAKEFGFAITCPLTRLMLWRNIP